MGLGDDMFGAHTRTSFVHGMCTAACKNQQVLDRVLKDIEKKLEMLASQTECPICLEAFSDSRPATTLGCAHKACTECWRHWCEVSGGSQHAPCPLCRQADFVAGVMRAASAAVPQAGPPQ